MNINVAVTAVIVTSNDTFLVKAMDFDKKMDIDFDTHGVQNDNTERIWAYLKVQ